MSRTSITMLNTMADRDLGKALDQHVAWGLSHLDLKNGIFDKSVTDLTDQEAGRVAEMAADRNLSVYCMSTILFDENVEMGEEVFRNQHLGTIDRTIAVARELKPDLVRLLAAKTDHREATSNAISYLRSEHPWLIEQYRTAVEMLAAAGFGVTIENECHDCIWSTPEEILSLFDLLDCGDAVNLTWDVQNLWQMGTFPSLEVYGQLKPHLAYYHVKGGMTEPGATELKWRSGLEDAAWPVREITSQVIADGVSPVICLNGSHGERKADYDYTDVTERDLAYVRQLIDEVGQ